MKFEFKRFGIRIDTANQPYLSYIIISAGLAIMGVLYVYLKYR